MSFFVTAIAYYPDDESGKYDKPYKCSRTFGHYGTEADATAAVRRNVGEMHECLYNYIVVEEIGYGIHTLVKGWADDSPLHWWWFKWVSARKEWKSIKAPQWSKGHLNWAIG